MTNDETNTASIMHPIKFITDTFLPVKPVQPEELFVSATSCDGEDEIGSTFEKTAKAKAEAESEHTFNSVDYEKGRTHRRLKRRQIELIAIGGTIGVALYVSIGTYLTEGGPLSLLLGYSIWCIPVLSITACCAEMVCYLPIRGAPFCIFADRFVDEAFGVMASWNYWVLEGALIPFELTLFNTLLHYWVTGYSAAIPLVCELVVYFLINVSAVAWYGEVEFWLCLGKVFLAVGLIIFTFIAMVGGNPQHDVFGFRNWTTGPVMLEYLADGPLGRFEGFLACLIGASYMIAGPEYLSMAAGETVNPRKVMPAAFKGVFFRLTAFFVGGALCIGILCSASDPLLIDAIADGKPGAGSSPYTIAMHNLGIKVLPHILNAMLVTSCFSAGNSYTFCSSRTLYGLACQGRAPRIFSYCNARGVPIFAILVSLCWGCLGFMQLSESANIVLNWIVNLVTASQLMNYCVILFTYIHFYRATKAQDLDRRALPFRSWFQPYGAIVTLVVVFIMLWVQGYTVFMPGSWSIETFLFSYLMIFVDVAIFIGWKLLKRTTYRRNPTEVDLVSGLDEVEYHERKLAEYRAAHPKKHTKTRKWLQRFTYIFFGPDDD